MLGNTLRMVIGSVLPGGYLRDITLGVEKGSKMTFNSLKAILNSSLKYNADSYL